MVMVAMEQYLPEAERILIDDLASPILPFIFRAEVRLFGPMTSWIVKKSEQKVPGLWGGILARKRYIDDTLTESAEGHIESVVNLGAGFDTRVFRLPALARLPAWEIDQPEIIRAKRARVEKLFGRVPDHVNLVPIDFDRQNLASVLSTNGFTADNKTSFILEGVTQYVSEAGIRSTFDFLSKASAGSRLVFTYCPKDFIEGENFYGQEYLHKQMLVKNRIWLFGIDPENVDHFIGEYGWRVIEHLGYDELDERYVKPAGRDLQSLAIERIVYAEKG
jgi:methyltransferase (TIGR00027 family)